MDTYIFLLMEYKLSSKGMKRIALSQHPNECPKGKKDIIRCDSKDFRLDKVGKL